MHETYQSVFVRLWRHCYSRAAGNATCRQEILAPPIFYLSAACRLRFLNDRAVKVHGDDIGPLWRAIQNTWGLFHFSISAMARLSL
jgi:hypothetical protein